MAEKALECSDHKPFITVKSEDGTEHTYYSILYEDLPEEILRKARQEVNETEENKKKGMKELKEYLKQEKLLDIDDVYVIAVLRCCKYDIKKAKVKLAKFVKIFEMTMNKLSKLDMDKVASFIDEMGFSVLPYRDKEGRIIGVGRSFLQMSSYDVELVHTFFVAAAIIILTLPSSSLLGQSGIAECKVPELRCFYPLMRLLIRKVPEVIQLPHRVASIKTVNEHPLVHFVYKIISIFIPNKIQKRISFLGTGYEELHKYYPPEILPEELGGYQGPMNTKVYKKRVLDRLKYDIENVKCSSHS